MQSSKLLKVSSGPLSKGRRSPLLVFVGDRLRCSGSTSVSLRMQHVHSDDLERIVWFLEFGSFSVAICLFNNATPSSYTIGI